jgi:hypothetical protein
MKTKVVNVRKTHYEVFIGRPSKYGNPFKIGRDGTREQVIELYRKYFYKRLEFDPEFKKDVLKLQGKTLGCYCKPEACHGDVILEYLYNVFPVREQLPEGFPKIICLCGSTKFKQQFKRTILEETMAGNAVLSPVVFSHSDSEIFAPSPDEKMALDELHKRRINLADEVLILNVGGYIGESTRSEINYARSMGKQIHFLEYDENEACHD